MSDNTQEVHGYTLAMEPRETTDPSLYSTPSGGRTWTHYSDASHDVNILWMGTCQCGCGYQTFSTPDFLPQNSQYGTNFVTSVWGDNFQAPTRDEMLEAGTITEDWEHEWLPSISVACQRNSTRRRRAVEAAQHGDRSRQVRWPAEFFTEYMAKAEAKAKAEREAQAEFLAIHPVIPVVGAYVWINDTIMRFDGWADDGKIKVLNSTETYKAEDVQVLTSIVMGVPHENAILVPGNVHGYEPEPVVIKRYSKYNATVVGEKCKTTTIPVNGLALLVPPLNPATEKAKDKADRLERELRRVQEALYRRMVAEGEARSWCSEFDPILDSNGLKPRKPKAKVYGLLRFEYEVDRPLPEQTVTKLLNGTLSASAHIPMANCHVVEMAQTDPIFTPVLS